MEYFQKKKLILLMSELCFGNKSDFELKIASLGPLLVWLLVEIWSDKRLILRFLGLIFCLAALQRIVSKMPNLWENPIKFASLQPSVTVAKRKIFFATMTHGCKGYFSICNPDWRLQRGKFYGIFNNIHENELTSENMYLPMNLAKKNQFPCSFFKVDSQNPYTYWGNEEPL